MEADVNATDIDPARPSPALPPEAQAIETLTTQVPEAPTPEAKATAAPAQAAETSSAIEAQTLAPPISEMPASEPTAVETPAAPEEILTAGQVEQLVREAALEAASGVETPGAENGEAHVVVGPGVRTAIRRGVMIAMKDLLGQALLDGPLKAASEKVKRAAAEAEALWNAIKEYDSSVVRVDLSSAWEGLTVKEVETETIEDMPVETKMAPIPMPPTPKEARNPFVPKTDVIKIASIPKDHEPPRSPSAPEPQETDGDLAVNVNGLKVTFSKNANPAFIPFLRAFVEQIKKGPVRPTWVYKLAQDHGWGVTSKGTVSFQIENHIGELSKWRDEKGDSWWSLPGDTETPSGTKRVVK